MGGWEGTAPGNSWGVSGKKTQPQKIKGLEVVKEELLWHTLLAKGERRKKRETKRADRSCGGEQTRWVRCRRRAGCREGCVRGSAHPVSPCHLPLAVLVLTGGICKAEPEVEAN